MPKRFALYVIIIFMIGGLAACQIESRQQSAYYLIDPRFSELYQQLQGDQVLGQPISNKKFVADSHQEKQYFESGILVYDPDASPNLYLYPVGQDAGFSDIPNQDPDNPTVRYVNGYIIPLEFAKLYDELGGERWVGLPLTRARFNPEKNTIEQYFENLGFFRYEDDPPGVVRFMPYGLWKCAGECAKYPGIENASVSGEALTNHSSPFSDAISRLGTTFTGAPLSRPYPGSDGTIEQVFENVVIYQQPSSPLGVNLRPIVSELNIEQDELQKYSSKSDAYFREVHGGKGFFIPLHFVDFINRYSGFELSGEPVSRYTEIREGVFRQCFEKYCLLHDAGAPAGANVKLVALGQKYLEQSGTAADVESQPQLTNQKRIQLDVWEQAPQISSKENQQVGACVHQGDQALSGIEPVLTLQIAGKPDKSYQFNPTDGGGCAFLELEPIQAQNGTTVEYQVCIPEVDGQVNCQQDSFLIWGNQTDSFEGVPVSDPEPSEEPSADVKPIGQAQVILDLWELSPQISSIENQEIGACIHEGSIPLGNMNSELKLITPKDGVIIYRTSPTDAGGCSFFRLDPIDAKNGEMIPYEVCFTQKDGSTYCQRDNFLIWGNP